MREQYQKQLEELKDLLVRMGQEIVKAIEMADEAFINQDVELAKKTIAFDEEIDQREKDIQGLCMKLLLRQQPVAKDLRFISSTLKLITDMERIGDHAADISEMTILMSDEPYIVALDGINQMAKETMDMVVKSIDAYVNRDDQMANEIIERDDVVDQLFVQVKTDLIQMINKNIHNGEQATDLLMVAKYFERIGDHATNIAEWVLYSLYEKE